MHQRLRTVLFLLILTAAFAPSPALVQGGGQVPVKTIDQLMRMQGRPATRDRSTETLKKIGSAAVPRLLHHLNRNDRTNRLLALVSLQHVWADFAKDPVIKAAQDRDDQIRKFALHVLRMHLSRQEYEAAIKQLATSADAQVATDAGKQLLQTEPNLEQMLTLAKDRQLWMQIDELLPRYHSAKLTPTTIKMLQHPHPDVKRHAIVALIHQQDDSRLTRLRVAALLRFKKPEVRDVACEYMRWHGTEAERKRIDALLKVERDYYVQASARAALEAIAMRGRKFAAVGERIDTSDWPAEPVARYHKALAVLIKEGTQRARRAALDTLRDAEPFTPHYRYQGRDKGDGSSDDLSQSRIALQRAAAGYTVPTWDRPSLMQTTANVAVKLAEASNGDNDGKPKEASTEAAQPQDKPMAKRQWKPIPPVRDYFDGKRTSFGLHVKKNAEVFADSHHVGDDVAWRMQHSTVIAIADGKVRVVRIGQRSWGGLVIIEHETPDGETFCSLYAHLGPLVAVQTGDTVTRGQKLGSLGRDFTRATGGYLTHLHFGIHKGPFGKGDWITGYIPPDKFKGEHGWVDPQVFLKKS